jgi:pimeloyl-ACP methyl ester carboxylesterase
MPTKDEIRPGKQDWNVGDKLWMYPSRKAGGMGYATLRSYIPGRSLGFSGRSIGSGTDEPENGSWSFALEPVDDSTTRLLIRGRESAAGSMFANAFDRLVFEPMHYVMERRMMIGIKQLADGGSRMRLLNHVHVVLWTAVFLMFAAAIVMVLLGRHWKRSLAVVAVSAFIFQILTLTQPPLWFAIVLTAAPTAIWRRRSDKAAFMAAYDKLMQLWPVPYEAKNIVNRFGSTHVVVSGPKDAPPLIVLHGFLATLTMWVPNIADFSRSYRVYAVDIMGQPSKSVPNPENPIRNRSDFNAWLTSVLDELRIDSAYLVGMSYGGWLTLNYAIAVPHRVKAIALLSPAGSLLPLTKRFTTQAVMTTMFPRRFMVQGFLHYLTYRGNLRDSRARELDRLMVDVMHLAMANFAMNSEALRIQPEVFSDDELRELRVPTLLLIGEQERIYDPKAALERARRLIPNMKGELVPQASHDMSYNCHELVDARIIEYFGIGRGVRPQAA